MVGVAEELRHLEEATRLIERAEALVAQQKGRLDQMRKDGHPTEEAEKTLADFEGALQAVRNTQGIIERTLRAIKAGALP